MEITTPAAPDAPLAPYQTASLASLAEALAGVTDPREPRGRRCSLVSLLPLMAVGLLCKAASLRAIARWGRLHVSEEASLLGCSPSRMPGCATLHRVLERLDAQELDQCLTTWLSSNTPLTAAEGMGWMVRPCGVFPAVCTCWRPTPTRAGGTGPGSR
jgi:hypothetical protein